MSQFSSPDLVSASGGVVIHRKRKNTSEANEPPAFTAKAIADAAAFVVAGGYRRVAVQFPDALLGHAITFVSDLGAAVAVASASASASAVVAGGSNDAPAIFVLADNTFGACCPDEITAMHYAADCVVHVGNACMSRTTRLPVHYVHETIAVDAAWAGRGIAALFWRLRKDSASARAAAAMTAMRLRLVVVLPVAAEASQGALIAAVQAEISAAAPAGEAPAVVAVGVAPLAEAAESPVDEICFARFLPHCRGGATAVPAAAPNATAAACGCSVATEPAATGDSEWTVNGVAFPVQRTAAAWRHEIVFVGPAGAPEMMQLALVALANETASPASACDGSSLHAIAPAPAPVAANALAPQPDDTAVVCDPDVRAVTRARIRQRMFNVQQVKKAAAVGIFVATLSIAGFRETAEMLRALLIRHGKRCYVVYIGHLNEFKAGNFIDCIDCFVGLACPNSRVAHFPARSDGFPKPLVSPAEVLIALGYAGHGDAVGFATSLAPALAAGSAALARGADGDGAEGASSASSSADEAGRAQPRRGGGQSGGRGGQLVEGRLMNVAVAGPGGALERLRERAWVGLDPAIGQTPIQDGIVEGRHGIARGYETVGAAAVETSDAAAAAAGRH